MTMQLLFLGAPGAGKGTQCKLLADKQQLRHLSSGDLLRDAVKRGTEAGIEARSYMDKGNLVPDEVLIKMFDEVLSESKGHFILDGFPRNLKQAQSLDALMNRLNTGLTAVINLITSDDLLETRITGRRVCPNKECNAVYHIEFKPPARDGICDECGTSLVHRSDDQSDVVKNRLQVYSQQTEPLIKYYQDKGLIVDVNGEGSPDEVFSRLLKALKVPA